MSNAISYTVHPGDTLSRIAAHFGKTVPELVEINQIANPNRLEVGQIIYLDKHYANSVQVMLMDVLRYPIEGLKTLLKFDGKTVEHVSDASGLLPLISTASIDSKVEVFVENSRKEWTKVAETVSGLGQQWLKLISPALKFKLPFQPHDAQAAQNPPPATNDKQNPGKGKATGESIQKGHAVKTREGKGANTIVLDVDIPQDLMDYFRHYKDEPIAERDWQDTADLLKCEANVLKAFAKVESGGRNAYWRLNKNGSLFLPAILYERHYFHRLTGGAHDKTDPDISWKVGYLSKKHKGTSLMGMSNVQVHETLKDKAQRDYTHDNHVDEDDVYSSYDSAYLRLLKAYRLDKEAALKSCSWGKFQIMGENFALCGSKNIQEFVRTMCSGEKGQIELLAGFIEKKPSVSIKDSKGIVVGHKKSLHQAVKDKDWHMIAYNYNGQNYAADGYHTKLEAAYQEYTKASA